jgi:hypothetical protein
MLAGFGPNAFAQPSAWVWLLCGGYRTAADRNLSGLATPARIALLVIIAGLVCSGVLYVLSEWLA